MCGIVGYISKNERSIGAFLVEGLRRLEYRGYDSVGIAVLQSTIKINKDKGTIDELLQSEKKLNALQSPLALGHTRWATHGEPSKISAHPHLSYDENIVLVHNGTIENYLDLLEKLKLKNLKTKNSILQIHSENDSKILSHFIASELENNPITLDKLCSIFKESVKGSYAIALFDKRVPEQLFLARSGSPLAVGIAQNGDYLVASDVLAFAGYAESYIDVPEGTFVSLSKNKTPIILSSNKKNIPYTPQKMILKYEKESKKGYEDFMIKEIFEQKDVFQMATTLRLKENTIKIDELKKDTRDRLKNLNTCSFFACGTSYNAALLGASFMEKTSEINTNVHIASAYKSYPIRDKKTECAFFVSQSGETADTLSALKKAKAEGIYAIAICNVLGSSITKQADDTIYIHAGPEISVASTKAFTSQVFTCRVLAHFINQIKREKSQLPALKNEISNIEKYIHQIYTFDATIKNTARKIYPTNQMLYLGIGDGFSIALEGALKLKELSYIFCFALPAGEMKHGTIALIDENMYTIFVAFDKSHYSRVQISIKELLARKGKVILFTADNFPVDTFNHPDLKCFRIPLASEIKMILGITVLLQLFAYHIAKMRGNNVDRPRNLAKSVTVA